jgi:hypothetical protein
MLTAPYAWTLITGVVSVVIAFWFPLLAWLPLVLRELYFVRLMSQLKKLEVKHLPQVSSKANELLSRHPGYYWQPVAGRMYREAVSLAGVFGLGLGVIGAFKGSWLSLGIGAANLAAMMALAPRFDPTQYLTPEYAKAHDELVAYLERQSRDPG